MRWMSRLFLLSALAYLLLGLLLQAAQLTDLWLGLNPLAYTATNIVLQVLLVGWLTQAAIGLTYRVVITRPRAGAVAWACLNLGLIAALVGQPLLVLTGGGPTGALVMAAGLLQVAGGTAFAVDLLAALRGAGKTPNDDGTRTALSHRGADTTPQ
jgi:hypothetical protein